MTGVSTDPDYCLTKLSGDELHIQPVVFTTKGFGGEISQACQHITIECINVMLYNIVNLD